MAELLIKDVSDTAFMIAAYRAMETGRPDALFRDPLAEKLAGEHGRKIIATMAQSRFIYWYVVVRTRIIDDFILAAIADGVEIVLNLGAGLDTRPYRMELPASLRWIEVDYPHVIELKEQRLVDEKPKCLLERVKLDLADVAAREKLFAEINSRGQKVLVLTEGVVPYLTNEQVGALADDLRAQANFRLWVVDYFTPQMLKWRERSPRRLEMANAPFRFKPGDYFGFFKSHGWKCSAIRFIAEEARRLKRRLPLPFRVVVWYAVRRLFISPRKREAFAKSTGYVLLEPGGQSTAFRSERRACEVSEVFRLTPSLALPRVTRGGEIHRR